jgi:antirestriction protein ArdC
MRKQTFLHISEMPQLFACRTILSKPCVEALIPDLRPQREDRRAIVRAASAASKAADFILGFLPDLASVGAPASEDKKWESA